MAPFDCVWARCSVGAAVATVDDNVAAASKGVDASVDDTAVDSAKGPASAADFARVLALRL
eukprot:scaffold358420_cov47-Attheya_sp.AAC.1